ncbi:hypothetical protein BH10ACI4_BH10ACI4_03130 [soil metagenome]
MGGNSLFDAVRAWFRRRAREKRLALAKGWPLATGEVLGWKTVQAHEDAGTFATPDQIQAGYYFTVKGDYFGGHFRSVAMSRGECAKFAEATPKIQIRYNPADPDEAVVLEEDNIGNLPFRVLSGD